jgi:hypothetical protein
VINDIRLRYEDNKKSLKDHYASKEGLEKTSSDVNTLGRLESLRPALKECKSKEERNLMMAAKELYPKVDCQRRIMAASVMEEVFMKGGLNINVSAIGPGNKTLKIVYALMSQPLVYQFQNTNDLPAAASSRGFTKIIYTNGFESSLGQTWTIKL